MARLAALPAPTTDLDGAHADLVEHGYCLVANALTPEAVRTIRQRLIEAAYEDVEAGRAFIDAGGANQRVWALLNRGSVFADLVGHPTALAMMDRLFQGGAGPDAPADYLLSSVTANIAGPGGQPMPLHSDQAYVPLPWPPFPLVANIAWLLDDTTRMNGATRIVPGSHRLDRHPDSDADAHAVPAEAPAGTALVFDGRTWHGTGANTTRAGKRHVVLAYYCRPWIRTQENHPASTDGDVVRNASPVLRRLLGFELYSGLGMINGVAGDGTPPAAHHREPAG